MESLEKLQFKYRKKYYEENPALLNYDFSDFERRDPDFVIDAIKYHNFFIKNNKRKRFKHTQLKYIKANIRKNKNIRRPPVPNNIILKVCKMKHVKKKSWK